MNYADFYRKSIDDPQGFWIVFFVPFVDGCRFLPCSPW